MRKPRVTRGTKSVCFFWAGRRARTVSSRCGTLCAGVTRWQCDGLCASRTNALWDHGQKGQNSPHNGKGADEDAFDNEQSHPHQDFTPRPHPARQAPLTNFLPRPPRRK